jgi:hypothetical protein
MSGANGYTQNQHGRLEVEYYFSFDHGLLDVSTAEARLAGELIFDVYATPGGAAEVVILKAGDLDGTSFSSVTAPPGWWVEYNRTSTPQTVSMRTNGVTCPADFNHDGNVSVQDIFDFLSMFFGDCLVVQNPPVPPCLWSADVNNSGTITVQDIFTYLEAFFLGCP